jgi:hypothetical protein
MSSDVSSASYGLEDSGINIFYDLKDFTPNFRVVVNPFLAYLSSSFISEYPSYNMVELNRTALTSYNCDVKNSTIGSILLIQYKTEFFCFKVGGQKQIKLF